MKAPPAADGSVYRPLIPKETCPDAMTALMQRCWTEAPVARPDLLTVSKELKNLNGGK